MPLAALGWGGMGSSPPSSHCFGGLWQLNPACFILVTRFDWEHGTHTDTELSLADDAPGLQQKQVALEKHMSGIALGPR